MSNVSDPVVPQHQATLILAPTIVAFQLQIAIWGISFASFARYMMSTRSPEESLLSRCYVSFVMFLNTVVTGLIMASSVRQAVAQHRDLEWFAMNSKNVLGVTWSAISLPLGILTRAFLARRAFLFTSTSSKVYAWSFVVLMVFLSALEVFGFAAGHSKSAITVSHAPGRQSPSAWLTAHAFTFGLCAAAAADVAISGTLAWQWIRLLRNPQGFSKRTDTALKKLTSFTLATASYTAIFATIAAILWATVPGTYWLIFAAPFSGMYTLSVFTTLNYLSALRSRNSKEPVMASIQVLSRSRRSPPADSVEDRGDREDEEAGIAHVTKVSGDEEKGSEV